MTNGLNDWSKKIEELLEVGDRLGLGIDEGIIEVVAALNLNGIKTTQSCEGHLDRALAYPWVQIGSANDQEIEEKRETAYKLRTELGERSQSELSKNDFNGLHVLEDEVGKLVGEALMKPIELVSLFYKAKGGGEGDERLVIMDFADGGRLQSQGGSLQVARESGERASKLELYRNEIKRFGEFLRELYLKV